MRAARRTWVEVGDFGFEMSRPVYDQLRKIYRSSEQSFSETLTPHVTNWRGITEGHLVPGGGSDAVEFSPILFAEWIDDQPATANVLVKWLYDAVRERLAKEDTAAKN